MDNTKTLYSIPMQGKGSYNKHSELQRDVLDKALHLLRAAAKKALSNQNPPDQGIFRVFEYGASQGANSIPPLETLLQVVNKSKTVAIELNDRPENDFTTLALTITRWTEALAVVDGPRDLLISLHPRSFYKRLQATRSTNLGYCFTCLHFLDNMPTYPDCYYTAKQSPETTKQIQRQAQTDLETFLGLRASEFVPGGQLLMSFVASGIGQHPSFFASGPGRACRLAMGAMASEGQLSEADLQACVVPVYFRTTEDLRSTLAAPGVREQWRLVSMEPSEVAHPAWAELEQQKRRKRKRKKTDEEEEEEDGCAEEEEEDHLSSAEYARVMVTWFLAVFEGFFTRAVATNRGRSVEEISFLVAEMNRRAVDFFLAEQRDCPVYLQSIYVLLERID